MPANKMPKQNVSGSVDLLAALSFIRAVKSDASSLASYPDFLKAVSSVNPNLLRISVQ